MSTDFILKSATQEELARAVEEADQSLSLARSMNHPAETGCPFLQDPIFGVIMSEFNFSKGEE